MLHARMSWTSELSDKIEHEVNLPYKSLKLGKYSTSKLVNTGLVWGLSSNHGPSSRKILLSDQSETFNSFQLAIVCENIVPFLSKCAVLVACRPSVVLPEVWLSQLTRTAPNSLPIFHWSKIDNATVADTNMARGETNVLACRRFI